MNKYVFKTFPVQIDNALIGNSYCNDETNNAENNYDGGDCCGYYVNTEYCFLCVCYHEESCLAGITHPFVGDGYCNDESNNIACNYDGGDCCGCVVKKYCSDCACYGLVRGKNPLVGNGICNDEVNTAKCHYDGGDCCVNINRDYCVDCKCLRNGVIKSPGFPEHYDDNLDMTWLIQVPLGKLIKINILHFKLNSCYDWSPGYGYDYDDSLTIFDGNSVESTMLGEYCSSIPSNFTSSRNELFIHFQTDNHQNDDGFKLEYVLSSK